MKRPYIKSSPKLDHLAKKYVWWEPPAWAYKHSDVFLANVMNLGNWDDIQVLRQAVGDDTLKIVLSDPPTGYFNYRSWDYWHVKFDILPIPPLPKRKL